MKSRNGKRKSLLLCIVLLIIVMVMGLTGCGDKGGKSDSKDEKSSSKSEKSDKKSKDDEDEDEDEDDDESENESDEDSEEEVEKSDNKGDEARKQKDIENYNSIVYAIQIACTDEKVVMEIKNNNPVTVHFTRAGVSGMSTELLNSCKRSLLELADSSSFCVTSLDWADKDFTIEVSFATGAGIVVTKTCAPTMDLK